ncbi:hypothetical protein [Plasticicumulans sp.]|uniref:hypothetical protein n=1 Tax=Plasticicumulans sp. TaxID=2307179 RepID=UPI0032209E28
MKIFGMARVPLRASWWVPVVAGSRKAVLHGMCHQWQVIENAVLIAIICEILGLIFHDAQAVCGLPERRFLP